MSHCGPAVSARIRTMHRLAAFGALGLVMALAAIGVGPADAADPVTITMARNAAHRND